MQKTHRPPRPFLLVLPALVSGLIASATGTPRAEAAGQAPSEWTTSLMMQVKQIGSVQVSPDGKQVAFTVRQAVMDGDKSEYLTHIHLANADGSRSRQLTQGDKSCDDPQWSPDGQWIAFVSERVGQEEPLADPARRRRGRSSSPTCKTDVTSFKWSPDGKLARLHRARPADRRGREAADGRRTTPAWSMRTSR